MGTPISIVGFASNNRVPGFYGETVYGAGAISAASIPLVLLLVGTKLTAGTATANQDIDTILSADVADSKYGAGSELALMCYAALKVPGVTIKAAPVAEAGGAVAASLTITISGTWSAAGTFTCRVNGEVIQQVISSTDTPTSFATALAAALNADPRRPYTASPSAGVVALTVKSKGARGNQYIVFQDLSLAPSGFASALAGGTPVTGGGVPLSGGTGTESASTLLGILPGTQYDRIVCAENDSTNLGLWLAYLNTQAGPTNNITEHFLTGVNGTLSATTTLATVTMNSERMQLVWYLNGENYPAIAAAYLGALRCATEQGDPDASYDDAVIPIAPQSQKADWPTNAVLQSAVNNGITAIYTSRTGSQALLCRSVTTHTLNGSNPDYRTLDTSSAYVPDFVRKDIGLYWSTLFKPGNPRVADDPPDSVRELPSGIATPKTWNAAVEKKLRDYARGVLASSAGGPTNPTVAPIIIDVDDNLPATAHDPVAKRLMSAIPVVDAPNQHQIGVSIRNVTPT